MKHMEILVYGEGPDLRKERFYGEMAFGLYYFHSSKMCGENICPDKK